jgi:hypothetical protein
MHFTFKLRDQLEGNAPSTYNKGGGGNTTTVQESGINKEFVPYVQEGLKTAESMYKTEMEKGGEELKGAYGQLGDVGKALGEKSAAEIANLEKLNVEGPGSLEARAEAKRQMGQDWNQIIGQDLLKTAGQQDFGLSSSGALGSARGQMAKQGAMVDKALDMRQLENKMKSQAAGTLAGLDVAEQQRYITNLQARQGVGSDQYKAAEAAVNAVTGAEDAPYRGLDRFFGYLGSGVLPTTSTSTQSGGGGK